FFVERALTAGKQQASVGMTFQHLRFTSLDGSNLRDGTLITTANQFVDEAAPFDVDRLALRIEADVATLYGNLGLTDAIEVGFAVATVGGLAREIHYGGAVAMAATGHLTVSGELLGRWLDSFGHIVATAAPNPRLIGVQTIRLTPDASTLQIITAVPGI